MVQMTREELMQKKQQEVQLKEFKKELKERVDMMELEYKELYYAINIPQLRTQYLQLKEDFMKQQEEYNKEVETMKEQMPPQQEPEPTEEVKPKKSKKIVELNPEE